MDVMHLDIGHFYERSKHYLSIVGAFVRNALIGIPFVFGWVFGKVVKFIRMTIAAIEEGYSDGETL